MSSTSFIGIAHYLLMCKSITQTGNYLRKSITPRYQELKNNKLLVM